MNLIRNNNNPGSISGAGIYSELGLANAFIYANTFANNSDSSIYFAGTQASINISSNDLGGGAVLLANTDTVTISSNTSTGNTGFWFDQIRLFGNDHNIAISCNTLNGGVRGIRISDENGTNSAITVGGASNDNNLQGHSEAGLRVDAGSYPNGPGSLNAENNWWGSATGPTIVSNVGGTGDAIVDSDLVVDYDPFDASLSGCAPTPPAAVTTRLVDDDGVQCPDATFTTITAAIAAAGPGDVVKVCAGNYPEQVNVNKTLTLLGAQSGQNARTRNTTAAQESVITSTCGPVIIGHDNVIVDGFTLQGASDVCGTSTLSGIYTDGSTGGHQILNNIIQNNTIGMFLNNSGADTETVQSNLFRNNNSSGSISGTGIYSEFGLNGALVDNNTFLGHAFGSIYFNGAAQTNVTISGNDLGGGAVLLANTSDSFVNGNVSVGNTGTFFIDQIRFFGGSSGVSVTCNHLTGGDRAIRVNDDGYGANSAITINNNYLQGHAEAGLRVDTGGFTGGTLNAENNYWGDPAGPRYNGAGPAAADDILDPDGVVDYSSPATSTPPCAAAAATLRPIIQAGISGGTARAENALGETTRKAASEKGRRPTGKRDVVPTR